jgi:hypothetical protein
MNSYIYEFISNSMENLIKFYGDSHQDSHEDSHQILWRFLIYSMEISDIFYEDSIHCAVF